MYPGGRIDPADFGDEPDNVDEAARRAAVREAEEEAGVELDPSSLIHFAEWTTPAIRPKRFRTWFFAARATGGEIAVDGGEIHAYRWMRPQDALAAQATGDIELPGPTFVTSHWLSAHTRVERALAALGRGPVPRYLPHTRKIEGGLVSLLPEDDAFDGGELEEARARHRIYMVDGAWRYERREG
ncbi:MAG: NUDIX domain-containing protein [Actinobacteria bacterium]|nr:NUDIX domain-containing protein [Actinomycetota bacterium]